MPVCKLKSPQANVNGHFEVFTSGYFTTQVRTYSILRLSVITHTDKVSMTVPITAAESPAHHGSTSPRTNGVLNQKTNAKTIINKPIINKTQAAIDDKALKIFGIFPPPINMVDKVYTLITICQYGYTLASVLSRKTHGTALNQ